MLWCGVPSDALQEELARATHHPDIPGALTHPDIPGFEVRYTILYESITGYELSACDKEGFGIPIVTRDRHYAMDWCVSRGELREWMTRRFPTQRPAFLFNDTERKTYAAMQADLAMMKEAAEAKDHRIADMEKQIEALNAKLEAADAPGGRAQTTYLNIIGAMLELMFGKSPGGQPYSIFDNQTAIIDKLLVRHGGKPGISQRTLEEKFAAAKRSLCAN